MNPPIKLRLTSFALAIAVLAGLIAWAAYTTWQEVARLEAFDSSKIASYETADHIQTTILRLNHIIGDYALSPTQQTYEKYGHESEALNTWIDTQRRPGRTSLAESNLLSQIDAGYDVYLATAKEVMTQLQQNPSSYLRLTAIQRINLASAEMFELARQLEDAHRAELERSLPGSRQSVAMLQGFLFGSLVLLLGLGTWFFIIIYREMIAPLSIKLVESSVIIERQEKLASLGMLAAGVAHEIRNPLTAIKARLFIQRKQLKPGTPEFADAEVIGQEINRLERIVRDFLTFARPSDPELVIISAEQPLREAQELLSSQLLKANIKILLEPSPPVRIKIDPQQIKQVIINLVQNAADSIGQNGVITLHARRDTRVLGDRSTAVAILEISDTGKGMAPEVEKRLFDPFFTTKESGTGLGLPIAARIVEKHGGVLQYQTRMNHGTTFGVVLPLADDQLTK
jgi:signal transduction histidine kinase